LQKGEKHATSNGGRRKYETDQNGNGRTKKGVDGWMKGIEKGRDRETSKNYGGHKKTKGKR